MNHATDKAQDRPVLNPESFQRLLAAAYLLQEHNDQQPSIRPQLLGASQASSFSAGKIIQKRTPAVMIRDRQLVAGQPDAIAGNQTARKRTYLARLVPFVRSTVPYRMTVPLRKPIYWRTVETVAIAIVFSMMMGLSILRLSAVPGRTSLASGALEKQDNSQPPRAAEPILTSSQTALFWAAILNCVVAAPLMAVIMVMASSRKVMGKLVIPPYLKAMGWVATAVMLWACFGLAWQAVKSVL